MGNKYEMTAVESIARWAAPAPASDLIRGRALDPNLGRVIMYVLHFIHITCVLLLTNEASLW